MSGYAFHHAQECLQLELWESMFSPAFTVNKFRICTSSKLIFCPAEFKADMALKTQQVVFDILQKAWHWLQRVIRVLALTRCSKWCFGQKCSTVQQQLIYYDALSPYPLPPNHWLLLLQGMHHLGVNSDLRKINAQLSTVGTLCSTLTSMSLVFFVCFDGDKLSFHWASNEPFTELPMNLPHHFHLFHSILTHPIWLFT